MDNEEKNNPNLSKNSTGLTTAKEQTMKVFEDFVSNTSLHGWSFFGAHNTSTAHKIFWAIVLFTSFVISGILIKDNTVSFINSFTIINLEDRSAHLSDAYFPSLVICNINPLRKSFIYWVHESLQEAGRNDVSIGDLFNVFGNQYFSINGNKSEERREKEILDYILNSDFFEEKFKIFLSEKLNGSDFNVAHRSNKIYGYSRVGDESEVLGEYSKESKKIYHENFLPDLASQWKIGQMVSFVKWDGMDPDDPQGPVGAVFLEVGYATSFGLCNFITPYYRNMPAETDQITLKYLAKGGLNGENNGLSLLLDAETFDYGNGFSDTGERPGVGFKIAVVHHLDAAVVESNGLQLNVGSATQLAVTTTILNITDDAKSFQPYDRKCWLQEEIDLEHFSYAEDYRYEMFNCLVEAAIQEAYRKCSCYPGYLYVSNNTCQGESLNCFRQVFYYLGKYREVTDKGGKKICMANCVDQTFRVTSSSNQYPGEESYNHRKDFCIIVRKLFKLTCPEKSMKKALEKRYPGMCDDVNDVMNSKGCEENWNKKGLGDDSARIDRFEENMFRYMKENVALLNIYLKQPYCEWILQDRLMKMSQFISNMGGILGLALGASIISLLEVVWYCFLCAFRVFRK